MLAETIYLLEGEPAEGVMRDLASLREQVDGLRSRGSLDDKTLAQLRREWKIEQVYETTGIEGNSLDLNETRMVIERGITISGKPWSDSQEALNMDAALEYMEQLAGESRELSPRDVREIQSLVVGSEPGSGSFRTGDVRVSKSDHAPPTAGMVPELVQDVVDWLNSNETCPPPLSAAVVHAWIAHIHPFSDGNGRTARALMNLILIRGGYPIVLIRRKDRTRYYDALAASDDGDIAPLVDLIVKRSGDSVRQIVRARVEATGLTEAVRRHEDRLKVQYETWRQAMLLLLRSIEEAADGVREQSSGSIRIAIREHDQVTFDDYRSLLRRDGSGNGWLAVVRGHGYTRRSELLLWNGYRTSEMARQGGIGDTGASIFVSEPDPTRARGPFKMITGDAGFDVREIAFDGGNFVVLAREDGVTKCRTMKANELASHLLKEFIDQYLA